MVDIPPTPAPVPHPTPPLPSPQPIDAPLVPSWFYPLMIIVLIVGIIVVAVVVYLAYKTLTKRVDARRALYVNKHSNPDLVQFSEPS